MTPERYKGTSKKNIPRILNTESTPIGISPVRTQLELSSEHDTIPEIEWPIE